MGSLLALRLTGVGVFVNVEADWVGSLLALGLTGVGVFVNVEADWGGGLCLRQG